MNERIRLLAEQAGVFEYKTYYDPTFFKSVINDDKVKKFAELIVRECLKELRYTVLDTQELRRDRSTDYQVGWEDGMFDAGEMIKQHFGVAE
jgi:hypothetical protein